MKRYIPAIGIVLFLAWNGHAFAAITVNATSSAVEATAASTLNVTSTINAGTNTTAFVFVMQDTGVNRANTTTYNGVNMVRDMDISNGRMRVTEYHLNAPATSAQPVAVTFAGAVSVASVFVFGLDGVDQSTPVDSTSSYITGTAANTWITTTVSTTFAGDWILDGIGFNSATPVAPSATSTQTVGATFSANPNLEGGDSYEASGTAGGNASMSWNCNSGCTSATTDWALISVKAAAGGGGTTPARRRQPVVISD